MSKTVKTRFVGLLRGLLQRFDDNEANEQAEPPRPIAIAPPTSPPHKAPAATRSFARPANPEPTPAESTPPPENPDELVLPLPAVLAVLPMDLRSKVMQAPPEGATLSVPIEKVLPQLAHGSVRISFGELRAAAPQLFVNSGGENDSRPVNLPLNEILTRLNPSLLTRRAMQKKVDVAEDIIGPFDGQGQGVTFTTAPLKPVTPPPPPRPLEADGPVSWPTTPPNSFAPAPARATRTTFPSTIKTPGARPARPATAANNPLPRNNGTARPVSAAPVPPMTMAAPAALPEQAQPTLQQAQPTLLAPLDDLCEAWPEALRMEIKQLPLVGAQVALPLHLVEPAMKRGRVLFSWRYVRSWIKPTPPAVSIHDALELELPLKVIAPLFFARQKSTGHTQRKVSVSSEIPNLFFGFPQPQAAPVETPEPLPDNPAPALKMADAKIADTNFYVWGENGEVPKTDETEFKRPPAPATDFSSRRMMPKDIVARALAMPGVAGAIVALQDGLKVAGEVPAGMNSDTLAAFLPQIFDRLGQTTRELRMGALNNINFTVGNVPWKIFRVSAVYFAAFGRPSEALPTGPLAALAAELDRKKQ
jgi:hypothetical protein